MNNLLQFDTYGWQNTVISVWSVKQSIESTWDIHRGITSRVDTVLEKWENHLSEEQYAVLAHEHKEMIQQWATSEEIVIWTQEKLFIPSWGPWKMHGKRQVLPTPKTEWEISRFQKFIEAIGIEYTSANWPSKGQPQYFLLDGFLQNQWLGNTNMVKIDKRLVKMNNACKQMWGDIGAQSRYILSQIGLDIHDDWKNLNIWYRSARYATLYDTGLWASGSLIGKMVTIIWINSGLSDFYENTASTGRLCFLK